MPLLPQQVFEDIAGIQPIGEQKGGSNPYYEGPGSASFELIHPLEAFNAGYDVYANGYKPPQLGGQRGGFTLFKSLSQVEREKKEKAQRDAINYHKEREKRELAERTKKRYDQKEGLGQRFGKPKSAKRTMMKSASKGDIKAAMDDLKYGKQKQQIASKHNMAESPVLYKGSRETSRVRQAPTFQ